MQHENPFIQMEPAAGASPNFPKTTDDITFGDPHAYLDEQDCIIWLSCSGEVQYMNSEGDVGVVCEAYDIKRCLGIFRGISIQRTGG